jgi:hypothetical protein
VLRGTAYAFFCGYVGVLLLAGAWGIVFARFDQDVLLRLDLQTLPDQTQSNVLSQYRFLRAAELGFGAYAFAHRREILSGIGAMLFLSIMAAGIAARLISLVVDGRPGLPFYLFLVFELVGLVLIYAHTRRLRPRRTAR